MPLGEKAGAFAREWRVILAALALLSFLLLIPLYPTARRRAQREEEEVKAIQRLVEQRKPEEAERRSQMFLINHSRSPLIPQVRFLMGQAQFSRARDQEPFRRETLEQSWVTYRTARQQAGTMNFGERPLSELCSRRLVDIANYLRDRGLFREAADKYVILIDEDGRREVTLELARCLALQALAQPEEGKILLNEALSRIDEYLRSATGEDAAAAHLAHTQILWRHRRYAEMEKSASGALNQFPNSPLAPQFHVEHGRALARLRRAEPAIVELEKVRTSVGDQDLRDTAAYFEAELRVARLDPVGESLARQLINLGSRYSAFATLLLGRIFLETKREDPYPVIRRGLAGLRDVREIEAENEGNALEELYDRLREEWRKDPEPDALTAAAEILKEYQRLYPDRVKYFFEAAGLYRLGADKLRLEAANRDPAEAQKLLRKCVEFDNLAGEFLEQAARFPDIAPDSKLSAIFSAAESYFKGHLFDKSARQYRLHYELTSEPSDLYWAALALKEQWIYESKLSKEPDALQLFNRFLQIASPTDDLVPSAFLERGRILMDLGRYPEAIGKFDDLMFGRRYDLSPENSFWAEALLLKGLSHFQIARRSPDLPDMRRLHLGEARKVLGEYLERYAEELPVGTNPRPGTITAAYGLGRSHMEDREWLEAAPAFQRAIDLASRIPAHEAQSLEVRLSHFLLGDALFGQERYDDALRAYETAYRKYLATDERLWALLGQAASLRNLGRADDAKAVLERARTVYAENKEAFDKALAGSGSQFWPERIKDLETKLSRQ